MIVFQNLEYIISASKFILRLDIAMLNYIYIYISYLPINSVVVSGAKA